MAKPKKKWPRRTAWILISVLLVGSLALVLVGKFAPEQEYIPKHIVEIPSKVVAAVIKPFQSAFAWATNGISGYLESWKLRKSIEIEYNKVRALNEQYLFESLNNKNLEDENARLKSMMGVFDTYRQQNPILASVTSRETGNWFQKFTIDKGEKHGIKAFMAVITAQGLVGYVDTVYETSADVLTIVDSRANVAGLIESSREQGMVRGTLGIENEASCRMYYLPDDLVPRPGDRVVSSGIGMPFPKGIPIGEVRESTRHTDENKQYFVIDPFVDFQRIEEVLVLVYVPTEEDMPAANDDQNVYIFTELDTPRPSPSLLGDIVEDPNLGAVTPPPRQERGTGGEEGLDGEEADGQAGFVYNEDPGFTLEPGATPTPNPELDALMREELEREQEEEGNG